MRTPPTSPPAVTAPDSVTIVEVAARDGLQSDPTMCDTATKVELIRRCAAAGLKRIETVSFVNPARVPRMADAEAVMAALSTGDRTAFSSIGLVLNTRGLHRAIDARVDEINFVVMTTDSFASANQGTTADGLLEQWATIAPAARAAGLATSVTVSASFGCPYEGEVSIDRLGRVLEHLAAHPPDEVALADSIGVAAPTDVRARVGLARRTLDSDVGLRCHFHNTRNTGLANAVAAVEAGVRVLDASLGGIGGCPFAPTATGNIPTEDLTYLLERMGLRTGLDLDLLCGSSVWLADALGHPVPGLVSKAGPFPRPR